MHRGCFPVFKTFKFHLDMWKLNLGWFLDECWYFRYTAYKYWKLLVTQFQFPHTKGRFSKFPTLVTQKYVYRNVKLKDSVPSLHIKHQIYAIPCFMSSEHMYVTISTLWSLSIYRIWPFSLWLELAALWTIRERPTDFEHAIEISNPMTGRLYLLFAWLHNATRKAEKGPYPVPRLPGTSSTTSHPAHSESRPTIGTCSRGTMYPRSCTFSMNSHREAQRFKAKLVVYRSSILQNFSQSNRRPEVTLSELAWQVYVLYLAFDEHLVHAGQTLAERARRTLTSYAHRCRWFTASITTVRLMSGRPRKSF